MQTEADGNLRVKGYSFNSGGMHWDHLTTEGWRPRISHRGDATSHTDLPLMLEFPRQSRARVAPQGGCVLSHSVTSDSLQPHGR